LKLILPRAAKLLSENDFSIVATYELDFDRNVAQR